MFSSKVFTQLESNSKFRSMVMEKRKLTKKESVV